MGITGLIPFLEKASKRGNISQFSGCTVAVDTYCWLHKGAFSCAEKLAMGQPTDQYVTYCLKFVNMLLANRIKPILVFDGCHLPAKAETESKRRDSREGNKRRAAELIKMGRTAEGRTLLRRSVDITHEMALQLMKKCHEMNVDCIVAPYEADAQLAYLNISGIADVIITEDSDLTLFGCKKGNSGGDDQLNAFFIELAISNLSPSPPELSYISIFFKMDVNGNGLLVEQDRLHIAMKLRQDLFDMDKFRHMCILSGCDYLPSLPGIGLSKACKFVLMNSDPDIYRALCRLNSYLNMKSIVVTDEYRDSFMRALATFKHQLVFCPIRRKQVRLYTPPPEVTAEQLHHAGDEKSHDLAWQLALGNYDPISLEKMHDYDPDKYSLAKRNSWNNQPVATHVSIWSKDFRIREEIKGSEDQKDSEKTRWPSTTGKTEVLSTESLMKKCSPMKRTYEDMENDLTDTDIMKLYGKSHDDQGKLNKSIENIVKENKKEDKIKDDEENDLKTPPQSAEKKSNPFLKKAKSDTSPCLIRGQKRRKPRTFIALEPTIVDDTNIVKSKYFSPEKNSVDVKKQIIIAETQDAMKPTIIPETQDEDLPLTQPDSYKENDVNLFPKLEDDQLLCRSDSGVELKDDSNDANEKHKSSSKTLSPSNCQILSSQDDNVNVIDKMDDDSCDIISNSQPQLTRIPSSDDLDDFTVNTSKLTSVKSSFFKWANPKADLKSNSSNSSISLRNSKQLQSKSAKSRSKKPVQVAPQNLLNTFGFQKKTIMKH